MITETESFEVFYKTDDDKPGARIYFGQAKTQEQAETKVREALKIPQNQNTRTFFIHRVLRAEIETVRWSPAQPIASVK